MEISEKAIRILAEKEKKYKKEKRKQRTIKKLVAECICPKCGGELKTTKLRITNRIRPTERSPICRLIDYQIKSCVKGCRFKVGTEVKIGFKKKIGDSKFEINWWSEKDRQFHRKMVDNYFYSYRYITIR